MVDGPPGGQAFASSPACGDHLGWGREWSLAAYFDGFAWSVVIPALLLSLMGLMAISDAKPAYGRKQWFWLAIALGGFVLATWPHYRRLARMAYLFYALCLVLLVVVLKTPPRGGAHRWIDLGPGSLQPSELAKLAFIIALAEYLRFRENYRQFTGLLIPFALAVPPMALIVIEPDLGTTLLFAPTLMVMLYAAGARRRHLLGIVAVAVMSVPLLWMVMRDYQRLRVAVLCRQLPDTLREQARRTFALPDNHMLFGAGGIDHRFRTHEGHHLVMSLELIRDGGWLGPEAQSSVAESQPTPSGGAAPGSALSGAVALSPGDAGLARLPENHTDFVFVVWARQTGFAGSAAMLLVFVWLVAAGLRVAMTTPDPFGRLLAVGIAAILAFQALVNMGMTVGLAPITGITLPFVSYGGSSLLSSYVALGLLVNVSRRRPFLLARPAFEFDEE